MLALMFSWLSAMLLYSASPVVSYSMEMCAQYRPQGTVASSLRQAAYTVGSGKTADVHGIHFNVFNYKSMK